MNKKSVSNDTCECDFQIRAVQTREIRVKTVYRFYSMALYTIDYGFICEYKTVAIYRKL